MILFLAGSVYGQINRFYDKVIDLEKELGVKADWVLQTGNFGVYPDPFRISPTMKKRGIEGDFAKLYVNKTMLPRKTLFVQGKHEDHKWINDMVSKKELELLPNLVLLLNGFKTHIGNNGGLSIVGLGKVYSRTTYNKGRGQSNKRLSHYTRAEVERSCAQGHTDVLLLHEPPKGIPVGPIRGDAEGTNTIWYATRPSLILHGKTGVFQTISLKDSTIVSLGELDIVPILVEDKKFTLLPIP